MTSAAKKILRRTGIVLFGLLVLLCALAAFVLWLVLTPSGLTFAAHQAERFVPGFHLERVEGDWRELRLVDFMYKTAVDTSKLPASSSTPESSSSTPFDPSVVPDFSIESIELADIKARIDARSIKLSHLATRVDWQRGAFSVPSLTLRDIDYAEPGVEARLTHLETAFDWNGRVAALPKFVLEGIRAKVPGAEANVKRVFFAASADATLERVERLDVTQVHLEGLNANVDSASLNQASQPAGSEADTSATISESEVTSETPQTASMQAKINAPFPINVSSIALKDLAAQVDGHVARLEDFETALEWKNALLVVKPVRITGLTAKLAQTVALAEDVSANGGAKKQSASEAQAAKANIPEKAPDSENVVDKLPPDDGKAVAKQGPGEILEALFDKPFIEALPAIALPIDIALEGFEANDWRLDGIPGSEDIAPIAPFRLERLSFRASLIDGHALLQDVEAKTSAFSLTASADATLRDAWPALMHAKLSADIAPFAPTLGLEKAPTEVTLDLTGAVLGKLAADIRLDGPVSAAAKLSTQIAETNLPFDVSLSVPSLTWPLKGTKVEHAAFAAETKSPAQATAKTSAKSSDQPNAHTGAKTESKPAAYAVKGFEFRMGGSVKRWSAAMNGTLTADLPDAGLKAPLTADLSLRAAGTPSQAEVEDLSLSTEIGRLALSGKAEWLRNLDWTANAKVTGVDAKKLFPKLPLTLEFDTEAAGAVGLVERPGSWQVALSHLTADGLIQGGLIRLRGSASADSDRHAEIPGLTFTLGKNNLFLKGKADNVRDISLELKVDVPGLLNTIPGLKGTASGYVRLSGSAFRPAVSADLRADGLGWQSDFGVDAVRFKADVKNRIDRRLRRAPAALEKRADTEASQRKVARAASKTKTEKIEIAADTAKTVDAKHPQMQPRRPRRIFTTEETMSHIAAAIASGELEGNLNLSVKGIRAGSTAIREVNFTTSGRETAMKLGLKVAGGPVEGEVGLTGGLNRNTLDWKGKLTGTRFTTPVGRIAQKSDIPLDFRFADMTLKVGAHCWAHKNAEVCLAEPMTVGRKGAAKIKLSKLDMAILKPYLRKRDKVEGVLTGEADVDWNLDQAPLPNARVSITGDGLKGQTRYQGVRFPLTLERLRLRAALEKGRAYAGLEVRPEGNGLISGDFTVDDLMGERRLGGRLAIEDVTPSLLKPFFAQGETAEGRMNADLRAGGTLKSPELYGDFRLEQLAFDATYLPVDMKPSDLDLRFDGQSSVLNAVLKTSTGDVRITGEAGWRDLNDWRAAIAVNSDKIRVSMPPMIEVDVTADVKAEADPALINLTGSVDIPWANITVGELPASGVSVSKDEVMLDDNLNPVVAPSSPIALKSAILVRIGDRVSIDAFGLKAGLTGGIHIVQNDDKLGLNGQITIPYGRFHAYGQDLLVRKGTIFFTGPAENPSLEIEAIRNPDATEDDVTAGIRVTGTASTPKVTLFSDPAKSQSETLSYLIRGQGLGSDDEGGSSAMTSMLIGLGATTGNGIMSEIGDTLGIKGLGLDTTGVGESSQVVVSGYVLPGLQVKYGVGIFDSLATLTLRYRLMPRLYLEAVSSVDQALDLLYRFDF